MNDTLSKKQKTKTSPLVLFDFDGTLVSGDNGTRMIVMFARSRIWPLVPMVTFCPIIFLFLFFPPTKHIGASIFLWLSTVGMSKKKISQCLSRLAKYTASKPEHYVIQSAWQRLLTHQKNGDRVVVVTGCWEKQAKKTLKALGLKNITVIGSRKKRWFGGYISSPHCYGPDKIICLAENKILPPWKAAYTDSFSDRHLFRLAKKCILVRPSDYSLKRMRKNFANIELLY